MATYLYLFRGGMVADLSPEAMQKEMQRWMGWIEGLRKSGHFQAGQPLEPGGKTVKGKKKLVSDGPYAEAKDLVGGYLQITAGSLDEAVELSRGCPGLDADGSVEVRVVREMPAR